MAICTVLHILHRILRRRRESPWDIDSYFGNDREYFIHRVPRYILVP